MPVIPNKVDMSKRIVIRKEYFDNINTAITSINEFFSSDFKNKNFPVVDGTFQLDSIMMTILSWLNNVEPTWVNDVEKVEGVLNEILEAAKDVDGVPYDFFMNDNNSVIIDHINAFVGYKVLQFIGNNFNDFTKLVNGIYSFELFTKPSMYKDCIGIFSQDIPIDEIKDVMGENTYTLFSDEKYVSGVFANKQITLPESLKLDTETTRFSNFTDLVDIEVLLDDTVQEAATVNMFTDNKPVHFKYNESDDTFKLSKQYSKKVDDFISSLRECNTTEDLLKFFGDEKTEKQYYPAFFGENVIPFILVKVFTNKKKYTADYDTSNITSYTKSYESIVNKNNGAKRFFNYDLFSTFKIDKESTINFISMFLKLGFCNDKNCAITNNALLTIFNIFDSRIYFDILYNLIPDKVKKEKYQTSDLFVKVIRGRINSNSRTANTYKTDANTGNNTTEEVLEYTDVMMKEYGDMSLTDMAYCEQYRDLLVSEINCVGDKLYNTNLSSIAIDNYIGESFIQEMETGDIPAYMKDRINLSDANGTSPKVELTDVQLPPDVPTNSIDDLTESIDTKLETGGDTLDTMLGSGYENTKKGSSDGKIVYNITNNYTNSFNRDSNNKTSHVSNDLSSGKSTVTNYTNSNNDSSSNKVSDSSVRKSNNIKRRGINNYNNGVTSSKDTDDSDMTTTAEQFTISSGYTVQEVFAFLESDEPLSDQVGNAGKAPKDDLLTKAMDADRNTLSLQQNAKKKLENVVNTGKAIVKPAARAKMWLTRIIDSLIKRDEDKVKAEIIENPSYRTTLYKAGRLALKLGLTGVAFTISGYLGGAYLVINASKIADKERLKKEVQEEFTTELEILDDKIAKAEQQDTPESRKAKWQMMRLRNKMKQNALRAPKSSLKHYNSIY